MQDHRCRLLKVLLVVALVTAAGLTFATPGNAADEARYLRRPTSCQVSTAASGSPDVVQVKLSDEVMVEKLRGDAALTHLYSLFSRRPEAFKAARKALMAKGFAPTQQVYVERTVRLTANRFDDGAEKVVPAQNYSESNSDGEIIFWSWDDGDDATWEGSIYVEAYSTGDASTWEGQIDDSNENHDWVYYEKTWSGGGSGPGGDPLPARFEAPPYPTPRASTVTFASGSPQYPAAGFVTVGWQSWATCWRACVVGACAAAAFSCILSGPAWPACFGFGCVGAEIGCGLTCWLLE